MLLLRVFFLSVLPLCAVNSFAAEQKCRGETQLRSVDGDVKTTVKFTNRSKSTRNIYWINYEGERVFYQKLRPGRSYTQQTYVTHPWVSTSNSGKCTGMYLPNHYPMSFTLY
jgi:VHL beta domain